MSKPTTLTVANAIIAQLGGTSRLSAMINARDCVGDDKSVMFRFSGSRKINKIRITLNSMDLYDVEFFKMGRYDFKTVDTATGVYNDQLKSVIETATKLYLSI